MGTTECLRPTTYKALRFQFEKKAVHFLLDCLLSQIDIKIDCDDVCETDSFHQSEFVLAPPSLGRTLHMLIFPDFWVGAYYARGAWYLKKGSLSSFIEQLHTQTPRRYFKYFRFVAKLRGPFFTLRRYLLDPKESRAVASHYEIEADLYKSFLDDQMLYTYAFFENDGDTLEQAQNRKLRLVEERLKLPSDGAKILDVGSGWGALERHFSKSNPTWRITGLSLAGNQIQWSEKQNSTELTTQQIERIRYRKCHYLSYFPEENDLFDGIVAIGMVEHLSKRGIPEFVAKSNDLLARGGRCLVHTIVSPESDLPTNKWIDANIFPGGYAPSISELVKAFEVDGLIIEGVYIHEGLNYVRTIEYWKNRYLENCKTENYDAGISFRTWLFYLSSVQIMFYDNVLKYQIAQIVVRKL